MTREKIKKGQKLSVLNLIRGGGSVSKIGIFRKLKIRPATIDVILDNLEDGGWIKLDEKVAPTKNRGRRPFAVRLDENNHYAIGVHFAEPDIRFLVTNLSGKIITERTINIGDIKNKETVVKKIISGIEQLLNILKVNNINKKNLLGIGLGVPGLVDYENGFSLRYSFYPWWRSISFKKILEERFGIPVLVDNDTRVLTIAEKVYGFGQHAQNFLFFDIGVVGIGLGIVLNGKIYHGQKGKAGEVGHITVAENKALCSCGNYGCLEALCSGLALEKEAINLVGNNVITTLSEEVISFTLIFKSARNGDKVSLQIVENAGYHLGVGVAALINLFNPELVCLGGFLSREGNDLLFPIIERVVKLKTLPELRDDVIIKTSVLNEYSGALGAATLILEQFFTTGTV